jgi:MFS family permease
MTWKNKITPYLICFSAALFFAYELIQMHMMNAISPFLIKDLGLNGTSFGNLCATYLLADVIFLLPAGIILDRFSTRKVILFAMVLCILGTIGFSFSQNLLTASISHFLSGIGNAFCFLPCLMLVSRWFPSHKQAFIVGMVVTIGMLGGVVAQSPFSLLAQTFSWRAALWIDASFGIFVLGLVYMFVQDSPKEVEKRRDHRVDISFWAGIKEAVFNLQNIYAGIYTSLTNLPLMVLGAVWGSLFLTQIHGISLSHASFIVSMICMGTIVGSPLYGFLSDSTSLRRPWMLLGALFSFIVMLAILLLPHPTESILTLLFFLLGLFSSSQILGYPVITENNPPYLTGTSMGVAAVIIMGLPMLAQPISGMLLDAGWDGKTIGGTPLYTISSYLSAFSIFPIGFAISFIAAFFIREKTPVLIETS